MQLTFKSPACLDSNYQIFTMYQWIIVLSNMNQTKICSGKPWGITNSDNLARTPRLPDHQRAVSIIQCNPRSLHPTCAGPLTADRSKRERQREVAVGSPTKLSELVMPKLWTPGQLGARLVFEWNGFGMVTVFEKNKIPNKFKVLIFACVQINR